MTVALVCLLASPALADDTHYRTVPVGSHPIGLGTAFTGVADDASAAYHNPAGLVNHKTFGIAGGLTVAAIERFEVTSGFQSGGEAVNLVAKGQRTLPVFVGALVKFGPRDEKGFRRYAIGYSVAQPILSRGNFDVTLPDGEMADTLTLDSSDRASFFGLSFAAQLNARHSIGVSTYLSVRKIVSREVQFASDGGTMLPGSDAFVDATFGARQASASIKAFHIVPRLGWLFRIRSNLSIGVMLQTPGIPLKQRADVESQFTLGLPSEGPVPATSRFFFYEDEVGAKAPIPLELEVGVGYQPRSRILLAMDVSLHGPVAAKRRVNTPPDVPEGVRFRSFFDPSTERRTIGNVAIAGDFWVTKKVMLEVGGFTDFSSAPKIQSAPTNYQVPRVHRYGATVSVGFTVGGVTLAAGTTGIFGRGDATGTLIDFANDTVGYDRTGAKSRIIYVHLTGASQAATVAVEKTSEWLGPGDEKDKANADDPSKSKGDVAPKDAAKPEKPDEPDEPR